MDSGLEWTSVFSACTWISVCTIFKKQAHDILVIMNDCSLKHGSVLPFDKINIPARFQQPPNCLPFTAIVEIVVKRSEILTVPLTTPDGPATVLESLVSYPANEGRGLEQGFKLLLR